MTKDIQIFDFYKLDSFSLLVPIDKVKVIDYKYLSEYSKVYEGGEIEESESFFNSVAYRETNGIKYKISKITRRWNDKHEDFIHLIVTAKMLKERYFEGINKSNIESIINSINDLQIVYIDLETALYYSRPTDVDICKDWKLIYDEFGNLTKIVRNNILYSKTKHIHSFSNSNLQLNERPKGTPGAPFVKFYYKSLELNENSLEFKNAYLSNQNTNDIARIEVNIKGYAHKKDVSLKYTTLWDLLNLSQEQMGTAFKKMIKEYMEKKLKAKNKSELPPSDLVELNNIEREINQGTTIEELFHYKLKGIEGKAIQRQKKRILALIKIAENRDLISINQEQHKNVIQVLK
ncbi:MAG: hypothetical protein WD512_03425, partial [Candidatus Paceibacterota bacterium]